RRSSPPTGLVHVCRSTDVLHRFSDLCQCNSHAMALDRLTWIDDDRRAAPPDRTAADRGARGSRAAPGGLDALGHGAGNAPPVDAAKPNRRPRREASRRRRRAPRGATRQAVLEALAGGTGMTAGQLATATGLPRQRIAPEL